MNQGELPVFGAGPQHGLWETTCDECVLFDACGGSDTAPCGCWKTGQDRYDCGNCASVCLERSVRDSSGALIDSLEIQAEAGRDLQTVFVAHSTPLRGSFPLVIHYRTDCVALPALPVRWVAAELGVLFSRSSSVGQPSSHLRSPATLRARLNASATSKVLAMLTGRDDELEVLWGSDRAALYESLQSCRVSLVSGPTFSICADSGSLPASHNVVMLHRHHRLMSEICGSGLPAVPNVYWRTREDVEQWISWLRNNPGVISVARDFSRTKTRPSLDPHLEGLAEILSRTDRKMHVFTCGIGPGHARYVLRTLAEVNATCTFVMAHPLVMAANHRAYEIEGSRIAFRSSDESPADLAVRNLRTIENFLLHIALKLNLYHTHEPLSNWITSADDVKQRGREVTFQRIDRRSRERATVEVNSLAPTPPGASPD